MVLVITSVTPRYAISSYIDIKSSLCSGEGYYFVDEVNGEPIYSSWNESNETGFIIDFPVYGEEGTRSNLATADIHQSNAFLDAYSSYGRYTSAEILFQAIGASHIKLSANEWDCCGDRVGWVSLINMTTSEVMLSYMGMSSGIYSVELYGENVTGRYIDYDESYPYTGLIEDLLFPVNSTDTYKLMVYAESLGRNRLANPYCA